MKEVWIYDLEMWQNFHSSTFSNPITGEIKQFVIFRSRNQLREYIEFLETRVSGLIGFNNMGYDYPILHYILTNKTALLNMTINEVNSVLHELSVSLIKSEKKRYFKPNEILIPQLDLYLIWHFDNKNKRTSLKYVEINTRFENVEDLPFDEDYFVLEEDIPLILEYNLNDVKATEHFYNLSKDDIEMRKVLRSQFGFDITFLNYNDPKIGESIFAKELAREMRIPIWELRKMGGIGEAEPSIFIPLRNVILDKIYFRTDSPFSKILDRFTNSTITSTTKPFEFSAFYKGFKIDYGVGGVHGCVEPGIYTADDKYIIVDIDIDGMYPKTAIVNKFYPKHLGIKFCDTYEKMYNRRIKAKKESKINKNNKSAAAINSGFKLALNGVYGKSNDKYSFLYDPEFMLKVTVNGQLMLSMLIEMVGDIQSLEFLQVNTDGITVRLKRADVDEFNAMCQEWEHYTGYTLEHANYIKMVIRDVNNYLAQYENGEIKHKGIFEIIPMQNGKPAYNKNWSMLIVPIALEKYYINDIPIEETIKNHDNIYDFCIAKKFPSPWHGEITNIIDNQAIKTKFKKNIRYYISNKGTSLWKIETGGEEREQQINVGFNITPFNKFENKENYDINYSFYISETRKIILTINDGQLKLF